MSSDEGTPSTIKRRLRSAGKDYAEHTLETAKNAAKGLENTHAAYLYPLKVWPPHSIASGRPDVLGDLLLLYASWAGETVFYVGFVVCGCGCCDRGCDVCFWICASGIRSFVGVAQG